jgi:exosortase
MKRMHIGFALLIFASVALLWQGLSGLIAYSLNNESSSHVILIPLITLALIYMDRRRIFLHSRPAPRFGIVLLFAGGILYLLSSRTGFLAKGDASSFLVALSLTLIWIGSFITCYGAADGTATFPLLFLFLMIPLPAFLLDRTIYFLQEGSTDISYLLFKAMRVPVLRQGFLLSTPGVTIEVAKECSGIRSSMALFITCILAAHLFLRTGWKMFFFVLLALPLALIKNGIRIVTLTLLSIYVDPSFLRGSLHRDGGFVFFLLTLAMLAPVLLLLQRSEKALGPQGVPMAISTNS